MSKQEFLNFAEISKSISFSDVLDWLNVPYQKKNKELKGEGFIVSIDKNLFFVPGNEKIKGSVINFVANYKQIELREAASLLKTQFLSGNKEHKPKRDIPNLTLEYHDYLAERHIKPEVAKEYEVGFVKQRSIMTGRIAFKLYDEEGNSIGYIGYKLSDDSWLYPKGYIPPLFNIHKVKSRKFVIITEDPFDALRIISLGIPHVVSILDFFMTDAQCEQLKMFPHISRRRPKCKERSEHS